MSFFDNISDLAKAAHVKAQEKLKEAADAAQKAREAGEAKKEKEKALEASQPSGRTGDIKARLAMSESEALEAWNLARQEMIEPLSEECEKMLQDILGEDEVIIYKVRSSPDGDRSQLVLTNNTLMIFAKGIFGGQMQDTNRGILGAVMARGRVSMRIYPVKTIIGYEIQPQKGITVGHFQVLTAGTLENDNESRFVFDSRLAYFKSILLYRKILELQRALS